MNAVQRGLKRFALNEGELRLGELLLELTLCDQKCLVLDQQPAIVELFLPCIDLRLRVCELCFRFLLRGVKLF